MVLASFSLFTQDSGQLWETQRTSATLEERQHHPKGDEMELNETSVVNQPGLVISPLVEMIRQSGVLSMYSQSNLNTMGPPTPLSRDPD